ncbi:hypothetical protein [Methanosalsum zhilinae]|uniref:hypothetical protein n=1 Tax=Methanosalsum zhilinae TaxID=39669 RepID=UPI0006621001|nr:hypothetical protein [Methanosalsum zhilinae]
MERNWVFKRYFALHETECQVIVSFVLLELIHMLPVKKIIIPIILMYITVGKNVGLLYAGNGVDFIKN